MSYTVKIEYNPDVLIAAQEREFANVCAMFQPASSYIDSEDYEGTRYDSNVKGFALLDDVEPYATTGIPFPVALAQFKPALLGEDNVVEFEVDDYKEALYYKQLAIDVAEQGFTITVEAE